VVMEEYHEVGYNYRMSDLHAAVGVEQLKKLDFILARRNKLAEAYNQAFGGLDCVQLPFSSSEMPHTYQSYMIQIKSHAPKTRDQVMQEMLIAGVATRRGVMAIHLEPSYHNGYRHEALPVTEAATRNTLLLPLYPGMTEDEQNYVIDHFSRILRP
jgi:perosamine synthetase